MSETIKECTIQTRVRYYEVDRQNAVHHSNYARYFEMGRTELLRQNGMDYKDLEDKGCMLVVARLDCRFKFPATYDEIINITTCITKTDRVRIEHNYRIERASDNKLLCDGNTTLVHVDTNGQLQPLPDFLRSE